ncbi:unnamed protein product [Rhizopus stolonifer]
MAQNTPPAPPKHLDYNTTPRPQFQYANTNNMSAPSLSMNRQQSPLPEMSKTPPGTRTNSMTNLSLSNDQLLDHSHLKPGNKASLLSYAQTINMYREMLKRPTALTFNVTLPSLWSKPQSPSQ